MLTLARGKKVQSALDALNFCQKRASIIVSKLIKSAVANANVQGSIDIDNLYIKEIFVGQGPTLKRWRAKARGMAGKICKRTSHITVKLDTK